LDCIESSPYPNPKKSNSFPWLCEENCFCTFFGARGGYNGDDRAGRESTMQIAISANVCAFLLTAYALISLYGINFTVIGISSLARGTMNVNQADDTTADILQSIQFKTIELDIGWRSVAINNPNTFGKQVILFDDFCEFLDRGMDHFIEPNECGKCDAIGSQLIIALIVAAAAYLPSFGNDCTRLHKNYDVNCQRVLGLILSLISICGAVYAYYLYDSECFSSFHSVTARFDRNGNFLPEDSAEDYALIMDVEWKVGYGLIILWSGAGCKVIHFLCHVCIPTPNITRSLQEQEEYEAIGREVVEEGLIDMMAEPSEEPEDTNHNDVASNVSSNSSAPPTPQAYRPTFNRR
jgi:hypothetical protein